jgi:phenylpropionate dioxygenase-like ring-hydroxylating dioxygenase large terminal subunit
MRAETIAKIKQDWASEGSRMKLGERPAEFPALPEIAAGRYTRADFYQLEQDHLWATTWLVAGHTSEVRAAGSYKLWESAGIPVILVRGNDHVIRAFFNACQHRGGLLVTEASGSKKAFACNYHSWTYGLDGALNFVPDEFDFKGLDKSKKGLVPLRCETWGNLIFVNRDLSCMPLRDFLGALHTELEDMQFDTTTLFAKLDYDIDCNWKCVPDNFEEGYHVTTVHKNTVARFLNYDVTSRRLYPNGHAHVMMGKKTGDEFEATKVFDRGRVEKDPGHEITRNSQRTYNVFPNLIIPTALTQFPLIISWPRGPDACHVEVYYLALPGHGDPESEGCKTVVQMMDVITKEDLGPLNGQQKSIKSGAVRSFPLSYSERLIYHHHENLDRVLGLQRVPSDLAVAQILEPFVEA